MNAATAAAHTASKNSRTKIQSNEKTHKPIYTAKWCNSEQYISVGRCITKHCPRILRAYHSWWAFEGINDAKSFSVINE